MNHAGAMPGRVPADTHRQRGFNRWILLALSAICAVVLAWSAARVRAQPPVATYRPTIAPIEPLPDQPATRLPQPPAGAVLPYDESAEPHRDLQRALVKARQSGKRVLVVFGANWCPDCRALDRELHGVGRTAALVRSRYEVVKVDVGRFDRNLDFAKLYGDPIGNGIPSVVVVTPTNEVVYQTRAGELADARRMGADGIYSFFRMVADRPAGS